MLIAAIFYGVNVALSKLTAAAKGDAKKEPSQKLQKTKAMSKLLADLQSMLNKLLAWTSKHKNESVDVGDDISVPIPDLFFKYTKPMENVSFYGCAYTSFVDLYSPESPPLTFGV